jgi:hypothetical protein
MTTIHLIGVYNSYEAADQTAAALERAGVSHADIAIVTQASDGSVGAVDTPPGGEDGARAGAVAGTAIGAGAGLLAGAALMTIPGLGQIAAAGAIVAALAAAGAGAGFGSAIGGLVGSLMQSGYTREEADLFKAALERGDTVLVVTSDSESTDGLPPTVISEILERLALHARASVAASE